MVDAIGSKKLIFFTITVKNSHVYIRITDCKQFFTNPRISVFYRFAQTQILQMENNALNCVTYEILTNMSYNI